MSEENYAALLHEWDQIGIAIKAANARKAVIKEKIAGHLHEHKLNETVMIDSEGSNWEIQYQQSSRKKVDYNILLNMVGHDRYNQVVSETPSTALFIRKEKVKKKKTALTNESPVDLGPGSDLTPPTGVIS